MKCHLAIIGSHLFSGLCRGQHWASLAKGVWQARADIAVGKWRHRQCSSVACTLSSISSSGSIVAQAAAARRGIIGDCGTAARYDATNVASCCCECLDGGIAGASLQGRLLWVQRRQPCQLDKRGLLLMLHESIH